MVIILCNNKYTHSGHIKRMLRNHGWEKQQTLRPKGLRPKRGQVGKETQQKKSCHESKEQLFQMYMTGKKTTTKFKLQKQ